MTKVKSTQASAEAALKNERSMTTAMLYQINQAIPIGQIDQISQIKV